MSRKTRGNRSYGKYVYVYLPEHPNAQPTSGQVQEHVLVAGRALGRPIRDPEVVHHINCDPYDNRRENLVICEDTAYHNLIHQRMRARDGCGNANYRKCWVCGEYDDPTNLRIRGRSDVHHAACKNGYERRRSRANRLQETGS